MPWLLLLAGASGCASLRVDQYAHYAACARLRCPALRQTRLRSWAFRLEGCGEVTYWRCTISSERCCWQVASARQAMAVFGLPPRRDEQICLPDDRWAAIGPEQREAENEDESDAVADSCVPPAPPICQ